MHSIITLLICNAAYCSPCFAYSKFSFTLLLFPSQEFQRNLLVYSLLSFFSLVFKGCLNMIFFLCPTDPFDKFYSHFHPFWICCSFYCSSYWYLQCWVSWWLWEWLFYYSFKIFPSLLVIVCLHLWCSCLQIKCAFSPAGRIRFFLWKSVSHLSSAFSSFCVFGDGDFFQKEWFSLITSWRMPSHFLGKPPRLMIVLCRNFHVIWRPAKRRLQNCN